MLCEAKRNPRRAAQIESALGTEYFVAGQHNVAKHYLDLVIPKLRAEKWWALLATVLNRSLTCAQHIASTPDFLEYALQLVMPGMKRLSSAIQRLVGWLVGWLVDLINSIWLMGRRY
jgi:hypothetical protein